MNSGKLSRRSFIGKSGFLFSFPLTFSYMNSFGNVPGDHETAFSPLIHQSQGVPDLKRVEELLNGKDPLIWLFTGDSITHGAKHTRGYRSYPEIFGERIRWEIGRVRDIVINTGISGNTTQTIMNDFDWRVRQFKPSVVSLMIGTNDCNVVKNISPDVFRQNLESLLTMIRDINSVPIFHTPNVIIKEKAPERSKLDEYVDLIRIIAGQKQVILVDNYLWWQNEIKNIGEASVFGKWLNDPLHPNGAGHSEIARQMFRELSIFDPQAATCGGEYYEGEHY